MISFFASELDKFGGLLPLANRVSWGGEDHKLVKYLQKKAHVRVIRLCTPEFWHLYHSKANWNLGVDGRSIGGAPEDEGDFDGSKPWRLPLGYDDGPQVLVQRNLTNAYRCRQHLAGRLYPPRMKKRTYYRPAEDEE